MSFGEYAAWTIASLIVPIALPFGILLIAKQAFEFPAVQKTYHFAVKDGQLFWISISLAAAALYDSASNLAKMNSGIGWLVIVWFGFLLLASAIYIALWTAGSLWRDKREVGTNEGAAGLKLREVP